MAEHVHSLTDTTAIRTVRGPGHALWHRFTRRPAALFGLAIIVLFLLAALFAPLIAPFAPEEADFFRARQGPSGDHWLGTDELGRDVFSRLVYGARISLRIGLIAVSIGLVVGVPLGLVAGYYGGMLDNIIMRLVDILLSFPSILLAIGLVAILGPGLNNAIIAVGVVAIPVYIRQVRASVLGVKELDFVASARAAGASDGRIMLVHVLPQCLSPILVQSSLQIAAAIVAAAGLGFLGLGAPPDVPEWGTMLAKGRTYVFSAPHLTTFPGLAIMLVVMGFNLVGDALRDALDPRMRGR